MVGSSTYNDHHTVTHWTTPLMARSLCPVPEPMARAIGAPAAAYQQQPPLGRATPARAPPVSPMTTSFRSNVLPGVAPVYRACRASMLSTTQSLKSSRSHSSPATRRRDVGEARRRHDELPLVVNVPLGE